MTGEPRNNKKIRIIPLIICTASPLLIGILTSLLIPNMNSMYENLIKPFFAPPSIIFPIVWTVLYVLMGIASYKVYILKYNNIDVSSAIFVYAIQLLLNSLWALIFFGFKLYGIAFIELILLFFFVVLTIKRFYERRGKKSVLLLLPYFIWVIYAGTLNFFIWMLNEM